MIFSENRVTMNVKRIALGLSTCIGLGMLCLSVSVCAGESANHQAPAATSFMPPWQHGANSDVQDRGLEFTESDADNLADFHGNPMQPKLSIYVGGNYFFAMAPLVAAFEAKHPEYRGRLYWETLPPGLLIHQIKSGGTVSVGNMTWTIPADVYLAGMGRVQSGVETKLLDGPVLHYATNTLTLMIAKGNPKHIQSLNDLARPDLRLAMPNPAYEGIARQIQQSLIRAGGEKLEQEVYQVKVAQGTSLLTHIHHRQTPLWLMLGKVDVGVTWRSEALFQESIGHPIEDVPIPENLNIKAVYAGALVHGAMHPDAGKLWLSFMSSEEAQTILHRYGFESYKRPGTE